MSDLALTLNRLGGGLVHTVRGRVDRVWVAIALLFAGLALLDWPEAVATAGFTADSLLETAPYLLAAIGLAAYAKASRADRLIAQAFKGRTATAVALAAAIGAVSPFCSCGVIPLIAAALAMGVPLAPVMAFWLASPVIDPSMFALTVGTLGLDFAVAKTVAAFAIGVAGGALTGALTRTVFADPLRPGVGDGGCGGDVARTTKAIDWAFWRVESRTAVFGREMRRTTLFLGKWLIIAFALEALMLRHLPSEWVGGLLGGDSVLAIPLATLVGVPAYLNGYAALPVVEGLLAQGMAPGAALAFMVAGGITCIPAMVAVFALMRVRVFAAYVGFALAGSLLAGLAFQAALG